VDTVKKGKGNYGFNAQTMQYEDLVKGGVIDPTKVIRTLVEKTIEAVATLLTIESLVVQAPEEKPHV
jgi:chaperonin GroEL